MVGEGAVVGGMIKCFFSSSKRHSCSSNVTGVQSYALPISLIFHSRSIHLEQKITNAIDRKSVV